MLEQVRVWRVHFLYAGISTAGRNRIGAGAFLAATRGGRVELGRGTTVARGATLQAERGTLRIGERCHVGIGAIITAKAAVTIGNDTLIAEYVTIRDQDHDHTQPGPIAADGFLTAPVVIGDGAWIAAKATVLRGVTIGEGAIVAAGAVVTRDVPAGAVVAGIPARVVRQRRTARLPNAPDAQGA